MRRTLARCLFAAATVGHLIACQGTSADRPAVAAQQVQSPATPVGASSVGIADGIDESAQAAPTPAPIAGAEHEAQRSRNDAPAMIAPKDGDRRADTGGMQKEKKSIGGAATSGSGAANMAAYGRGQAGGALSMAPRRPGPPSPPPRPMTDATSGEGYTDHGQNAWTVAKADHLSTFAADVDTASFTIARRKLREGQLPPTAAVRVEEFVNYFRYGYDTGAATKARPFTVSMDGAASPFDGTRHLLRVGVASAPKPASERPAANLVFLVDVAGSMQSPDKLELAKRSLRILVDSLKDGDTVSLVTYAGATRVVLPPTGLEHKEQILGALEELTAGGSTAMASGIQLAYEQAAKGLRKDAISRVIVLSDGDANVGHTSADEILATIAKEVARGVTLSTIGFGQGNYQDKTMERLANRGNGNAYYIDSLSQAKRVFSEQLGSTLEVIAKDVKLQVDFDPAQVARYRLVGYENRDIADDLFRDDKVDAGEIGAGHQVTALYELELTGAASSAPLATVRVRHKAPTADTATEAAFTVDRSAFAPRLADASRDLRLAFAAAAFADVLRGGADAQTWDLTTIRALAAAVADDADGRALVEMIDAAIRLRGGGASTTTTLAS
ncbi:MAG: von Willebrand factor type A domain-containing protein [Kofleriaceae bacterium]